MSNKLNINEIKKIIPHRSPFLLVDKAEILTPGKKGIGYKNVTIGEPFFTGHFPEEPIMPGVLIVEALAQVGAIILLSEEKFQGKTPYFAGLNKVRFKRKVIPGDTLNMEVEITRLRGSIGIGQGKAFVDDELACEGEFLFAIGD
ncbi:3-hydroxyacyl-[acyl-carrier-protein] dehydratase [Keratinibaculum paraultunense]|uniref:3-hydroxyacyl-[acyl-carrier-protein] dehydratase FabZ n=1 Tax=Keratinibaculum paraultunense TaxID=1278232 RepID=A0A4R3KYB7_9FIRM|nr:3-hydroxyacyl-ACP dehydratase FabZ [Keratinibaculum paraultunense]QQY80307.1 3-hydroxyacyl-ACP dehydratase FabZ [Keratinibaculum paraultunense]TCS90828.1 3-hydroxyacyl-[acyl-carrier-protein] dehydratase [Keratinibaculum paraultunense]